MSDKSVMSARQSSELDHAFERGGWTAENVKWLSSGDALAKLLPVAKGLGKVVITKHVVDLDADPMVPDGWTVEEHTKGGQLEFNLEQIALYLDEQQQDGGVIVGNELRKKLEDKPVYNANLLEFYLANPNLIPEEWKGKYVFFWGTIYRNSSGDLCVRYLCWDDDGWFWNYRWLDNDFYDDSPAVVPASN